MSKIEIKDFIPPLIPRVANFINRKISAPKVYDGAVKFHPFDALPNDIDVKWILDIGANVGDVTINALKSYPKAQVICFEPVKETFKILEKNLKSFSNRTHLFNLALSDKKETGEINITNFHGANSICPQARFHQEINPHVREVNKEKINLVRMDDFSSKFPSQKIDIMKIDVEGHELNVLYGGENFIKNNVDVVLIEIALMRDQSLNNQSVFEIFSFFKKAGFCLVNVTDLNHVENQAIQLVQMDCVFRNTRYLT